MPPCPHRVVADNGVVVVSPQLTAEAREALGLAVPLRVERLADGHREYLKMHQALFRA